METNIKELLDLLKRAKSESERLMYRTEIDDFLCEKIENVHYHVCEALNDILEETEETGETQYEEDNN